MNFNGQCEVLFFLNLVTRWPGEPGGPVLPGRPGSPGTPSVAGGPCILKHYGLCWKIE